MRWVPRGEPKVGEPLGGDMADTRNTILNHFHLKLRILSRVPLSASQSPPLWSHLRVPPGHLQLWVLPGISHINFMVLNLHKII